MAKCKACRCDYTKTRSFQQACSIECALKVAQAKREQDERKEAMESNRQDRKRREEMKTLPTLKKEAQREFNRYVRLRDVGRCCISCGLSMGSQQAGGSIDAGHYRSVGSAPQLRFNEDNCHAQCKHCNQYLAGNPIRYRDGLVQRIGLERMAALESNSECLHLSRAEVREIRDTYRAKANALSKTVEALCDL